MWLLSWAILALVIIYSPIGSPDLYTGNKYIVYNQGVNFSGGIANAPKVHNYNDQYPSPDLGIPTYTPEQKSYTVNSASGSSNKVNKETNYSVSTAITGRTGTNTSGTGGVTGIANFSSTGSSQKNSIDQNTGIGTLTLSGDLTTIQNPTTTTRQGAGASLNGGTDPGGDPTGPPIPVGDGFWISMFLAVIYILIKRKLLSTKCSN